MRLLSRSKNKNELLKTLQEKDQEIKILRASLVQKSNLSSIQITDKNIMQPDYNQEKDLEIKELLSEYKDLQIKFDSLDIEKFKLQEETIKLRNLLNRKSENAASKSDGFGKSSQILHPDQEIDYLKQICADNDARINFLEAELKIFRDKKQGDIYDLRGHLLTDLNKAQLGEDEIALINYNLTEIIQSRIIDQVEILQPSIIDLIKTNYEIIYRGQLNRDIESVRLNAELKRMRELLANEKSVDQDIKRVSRDSSSVDQ